jgi:hypothetical protein
MKFPSFFSAFLLSPGGKNVTAENVENSGVHFPQRKIFLD